jgi:hypothetical protein
MRRQATLLALVLAAGSITGCVERRFVITSDPPAALVMRNGQPLGATPADDHFVYYGKYHFTLIAPGYETLQVEQDVPAPWYEYPGIDFISEVLLPWPIQDVRRFHYRLEPQRMPNTQQLLDDAQNLRNRGQTIAPPEPSTIVPGAPPQPSTNAPGS